MSFGQTNSQAFSSHAHFGGEVSRFESWRGFIFIHFYPFLSIFIHFYPFLSIFIHFYPFLSIFIHFYPFFRIFAVFLGLTASGQKHTTHKMEAEAEAEAEADRYRLLLNIYLLTLVEVETIGLDTFSKASLPKDIQAAWKA